MHSIDEKQRNVLTKFYENHVLPLSEVPQMRQLQSRPQDSSNSFFVSREQTRMQRDDFELAIADEREIAKSLERLWTTTPLQGLAKKMMKLTRHFADMDQSDKVSSFVYEMF